MLHTIQHYEYRLEDNKVVYARNLNTGKFVSHKLVQSLVDANKPKINKVELISVLLVIALIIFFNQGVTL